MLRTDVSLGRAQSVTPDHRPPPDMVQLLTPDGVRHDDPVYDPWVDDVDDEQLMSLYDDMVVVRRFDTEAVALQRQGQLGLWPPLLGQEAAQIGSARALRPDDFAFTSYRENGVAYCRGAQPTDLMRVWRGTALSGWDPRAIGMATPQVMIGAQALHATGYALGCVKDGVDSAVVAYFGDGATSKGDVHEAMVFAASFGAPVVFFCQNNQWAISEPVGLQTKRADRRPRVRVRHPEHPRRRQRRPRRDRRDARGARPGAHRRRPDVHRGGHLPDGPAHDVRRPDALRRRRDGAGVGGQGPDRCGWSASSWRAACCPTSVAPRSRAKADAFAMQMREGCYAPARPGAAQPLRPRPRRTRPGARTPAQRVRGVPGDVRGAEGAVD